MAANTKSQSATPTIDHTNTGTPPLRPVARRIPATRKPMIGMRNPANRGPKSDDLTLSMIDW